MATNSSDSSLVKIQHSKTLNFVDLYRKSDYVSLETNEITEVENKENKQYFMGNPEKSEQKFLVSENNDKSRRNASLDISSIKKDSTSKTKKQKKARLDLSKDTSTPIPTVEKLKNKSIMKSPLEINQISSDTPNTKRKKRIKNVSFNLEENEEVLVKKPKSEEVNIKKSKDRKKHKKFEEDDGDRNERKPRRKKAENNSAEIADNTDANKSEKVHEVKDETMIVEETAHKKKRTKKNKKQKKTELESEENVATNEDSKLNMVKRKSKTVSNEAEEPQTKSRKKDVQPELIAENLENLTIGDNPNTLTNLLDDMKIANKNKNNKGNKGKNKKGKSKKIDSDTVEDDQIVEKEKIKWNKRKWNKDNKFFDNEFLVSSIIVGNLPVSIILTYKKLLSDFFSKCGAVKSVGIAEMYPTEDLKPVFTTTIKFDTEEAVLKALEENNTLFEGSRIQVKRPLPPSETTVVVRSFGEITDQGLSSIFISAGKIRKIKHLSKGGKTMATTFVEFDGPESVEKAMKLVEDVKIGGKKLHVNKYDMTRNKRQG